MIIIAGTLRLRPTDRSAYLEKVAEVTRLARSAPGCADFVQAPDPLDPGRINIYERWESDDQLHSFRTGFGTGGAPSPDDLPPIVDADVRKYRISAVEAP